MKKERRKRKIGIVKKLKVEIDFRGVVTTQMYLAWPFRLLTPFEWSSYLPLSNCFVIKLNGKPFNLPFAKGTSGCLTESGEDNVLVLSVHGDIYGSRSFCSKCFYFMYLNMQLIAKPIILSCCFCQSCNLLLNMMKTGDFLSSSVRFHIFISSVPRKKSCAISAGKKSIF